MLMVVLLIHLSGGRPEFHFYVFVSLAVLALYQDWRVLLTASLIVAVDHFLRGIYWPRSVFGLRTVGFAVTFDVLPGTRPVWFEAMRRLYSGVS